MVPGTRLELVTSRLSGGRSNQLSYPGIWLLSFDSNEDLTEPESVALPIKLERNFGSDNGI